VCWTGTRTWNQTQEANKKDSTGTGIIKENRTWTKMATILKGFENVPFFNQSGKIPSSRIDTNISL
jgi:hypothetical protein